jgi:hypothetical protein
LCGVVRPDGVASSQRLSKTVFGHPLLLSVTVLPEGALCDPAHPGGCYASSVKFQITKWIIRDCLG